MPHDPETGEKLVRQTPQQIVDRVMDQDEERFQILAPVVRGRKGTYDTLVTDLAGQGFTRAVIDGEMINLNDVAGTNEDGTPVLQLERYEMHDISVIVDRLVMRDGIDRRLTDSIETALKLADGVMQVEILKEKKQSDLLTFSIHFSRPSDGKSLKS